MMPNLPSPYEMRDWRAVAIGYDSLLFDLNSEGEHLPLIFATTTTVNYPEHGSFGLHSYVGTRSPRTGEAINVLPAVVGAALVGIDKHDQNGFDWVLMCEEYFNRRPEENVYLNLPVTESGDDWWYETMPNVFFYQLYDIYRGTGDFENQFGSVAERWLLAVKAMGARATPWSRPNMDHRAWRLATMTPNRSGVREPEAAGAIAWLLYHAYLETGEEDYRVGAEWALEFLNARISNPSYELQLPYGVLAAARMNAEIGTSYNIEKMMNWCFEVGPLRQWGTIVGRWNGYDVHGLIGEALDSGHYAFAMNGFEQVGALVPMVRYDDRFARAIGKWVLNVANASRLFYSSFLPPGNQDNEDWAAEHDPDAHIAYEGLRREWFGVGPYATGDAMRGGWAATNLGLYGSSHVGIFGGIIDTTEIPMLLRLDMLKTDYFHAAAYPTYLYFNPHPDEKTVTIDVGSGARDLYDCVSNTYLAFGVTGKTPLTIPADAAVQLVIAPAGGAVTFQLDRMLIDGVVVDYQAGRSVANYPPRIKSLAARDLVVSVGDSTTIYCTAEDLNQEPLSLTWQAASGQIIGESAAVKWLAPAEAGAYSVTCSVADAAGAADRDSVQVLVLNNHHPTIVNLSADPPIVDAGDTTRLTCVATDPDGDNLTYAWHTELGSLSGSGASVIWTPPAQEGYYAITCVVSDGRGTTITDSVGVVVGRLVAQLPFNGNSDDASAFGNHGEINGATFVDDRFGETGSALLFDGDDDFVRIPVRPSLNFEEATTISFWMSADNFPQREMFVVSHGSWQNRWKISVIPSKRVRWTLKTDTGILDLDSHVAIAQDSIYNVTCTFGDGLAQIYLNGVLSNSKSWSGKILLTSMDLTIGQMLPGNSQYNFAGVIDDLRIYNRVLTSREISELYDLPTSVRMDDLQMAPKATQLFANFPNPFNPSTTIRYQAARAGHVTLKVFNLLGQEVRTLVSETQSAGVWQFEWDGLNTSGQVVSSGIYLYILNADTQVLKRKMILLR